jgi:putative Holliday junction resolvase
MTAAPPPPAAGSTTEDAALFAQSLAPGARLLGLDLGTKTIGMALSDVTRTIASAYDTWPRGKLAKDAAKLQALSTEHGIGGLVLGLPANLDGSEGPRAQATRAFARNLNRFLALPVLLWDERLTTAQAERMLIGADASRRRRAELIDKVAATLILQGALDRMRGV